MEFIYNENEKALIFFTLFDLSYKKEEEILFLFNEPCEVFGKFYNYEKEIKQILKRDAVTFEKMAETLKSGLLKSYISNLNDKSIQVVTQYSDTYPEGLRQMEMPPFALFCKGDVSLLKSEGLAIVGTRTPTAYGKIITEQFSKGLVQNGFTIVSGMANGVDTVSHKTALENSGKTIAVLGGGFEHIYPANNAKLAEDIIEKGLLVSEYRPSMLPTLYTFPFRNRIIAGLSKGVLITEAGEKSGALHTKEFALEMGREVFAVPGNITSSMSKGTNRLIRSAQGACVLSYEDIVCLFHQKVVTSNSLAKNQVSFDEQIIVNLLDNEEKNFEQLQEATGMPTNKLNAMLTMLQIKGVIKQLPGNLYIKAI